MAQDYMVLLGAEQVQQAASTMSSAASEMQRAANNVDGSLERHQRWMDDWLLRFSDVLEQDRQERMKP